MGIACFSASLAFAGEIVLPSNALERDHPVTAVYRTNGLATGRGELAIRWTDVYGRVVEDRKIPFELNDETDVGFTLDLRRAVAMKNELRAHFSFDGVNKKGAKDHREEDAQIAFVARPPSRTWWDYTIIMWQHYPAELLPALEKLGINASEWVGRGGSLPGALLDHDLRWYVENLATDFYSAYHRYYPDRPNQWAFLQAKELYKKDPSSLEAFKRHPSFSDAAWQRKIRDRLAEAARIYSPYRPVFYSLGDESGIADLAAYWDFDFSDESLAGMREWLKQRYGTLAALNRQWGTGFASWDLVMPMTTNQAMQRAGDNFSSWADFKEWMDISYARALEMGAAAVRAADPEAYVGIGGGQMPGWGGYDYARLTKALTAIEPYDIGENIEIIRSLNPRLAVVTTSFARGPREKHRVWYELLHGNRGLIIWDDKYEYVNKDGSTGPRGQEAEPYYAELRNGIGALLAASERQADPIAIHYSQASMRTEWMLAQRPKGEAWVNRSSSSERRDSEFLRLRESFCRLLEDLGLQYNFVSYDQVEQGELLRRGYRVLILPRSSALSAAEAQAIREFVQQGGVLLADGVPGAYDEHSRKLDQPQLADLFGAGAGRGKALLLQGDFLDYRRNRLAGKVGPVLEMMGKLLEGSGVRPAYGVTEEAGGPAVGVETHVFRDGGVTIVGLLSNPQLRVDDLGPPEFRSNQRFEKPRTVKVSLPAELYIYDIRKAKALGKKKDLLVPLDPYEPAIFAVSPFPLPALAVAAPARLGRGQTGDIGLSFGGATPAAAHVLHVDVIDPSGKTVLPYSGNVLARRGHASRPLPLALHDPAGKWEIRVKDLLSGQTRTAAIEVF
ncbi:MAG TPA: alpha-amylase family protein [Bryobacterales bacterium]|nr:alpha-amylase family protein [Bryobacterales bacterium]